MNDLTMNSNELVKFLRKPAHSFTRSDLVKCVENYQVKMVNFRYVAEDGKLKTLNFIINSREHLESILTYGERVDGSSLFSFIDAGSSDLYLLPRYRTAFLNPFSETPAMEILCTFYNQEGAPLENAPDYILKKALQRFREETGYNLLALGELEYYVNSPLEEHFIGEDQGGYHSSTPFCKWEHMRVQALDLIARTGGQVKYGHSEVGSFTRSGEAFEQHEIEFLPMEVEDAADQLVIAKWILRMLADSYGVEISFAPKISEGMAGSGLHIHMLLEREGRNVMNGSSGLSDDARRMIAGILDHARALTAFGNTVPTSYLRLVPNQEAPTRVCWGDRNRSVLVRVPLGWDTSPEMINRVNPQEPKKPGHIPDRQTVELRSADGSADIYNLLAGILVAARKGLTDPASPEQAGRWYVDVDIFRDPANLEKLASLPLSCHESSLALEEKREAFEEGGVFPKGHIDSVIRRLQAYNDEGLSEKLEGNTEAIRELVLRYIHVM